MDKTYYEPCAETSDKCIIPHSMIRIKAHRNQGRTLFAYMALRNMMDKEAVDDASHVDEKGYYLVNPEIVLETEFGVSKRTAARYIQYLKESGLAESVYNHHAKESRVRLLEVD